MHEMLKQKRSAPFLTAMCFAIYCGQYLGRYCLSACISSMVEAGAFTKTELGSVATCFFLSYALMQIPGGVLGDRVKASALAAAGLGGSALITLVFPSLGSVSLMRALWLANGILQALVWPALIHILSDVNRRTPAGEKPLMSIVTLSLSGPAGVLMSYGLCALLLRFADYSACFRTAGVGMLIITALWVFAAMPLLQPDREQLDEVSAGKAGMTSATLKALSGAALPVILLAAFVHGLLKDGLTTWIPTYLTEALKLSPQVSLLLTMSLPLANFGGVWLADTANRRWFRNEMTTSVFCFGLTLACLGLMILLFPDSIPGTIACFAGVSCLMTAVNTLIISILPLHFARLSVVSTLTGILDAAIYLGSALSTSLFAALSDRFGWNGTRMLWCLCALAGIAVSLACVKKWARFRSSSY